jgi:hypothetical protein
MSELQESERVPAKRRRTRTRNEGSRDGGQSDHSMASSQPPPLLLSWSVNSDASGPSRGSQGAAAASSSMAATPSITPNKDNQLYRLVVQQLFPSYHPDEMALINAPAIGEGILIYLFLWMVTKLFPSAVNEKEARTKGISLRSGDKNRVFSALEDHKELLKEVLTFNPYPKGSQKHGNDLLHMHLLSLYSRAFGPNRTKVFLYFKINDILFELMLPF